MIELRESFAVLSKDGRYRYWLERRWGLTNGPKAIFVMHNPSTATGTINDPTIRRCMCFGQSWGLDGIAVVNLYGYRATNPRELRDVDDPIGPDNDIWLRSAGERVAAGAGWLLIAAWGAGVTHPLRAAQVCKMPGFDRLVALGTTKAGQPRHPLYVRADAASTPWVPS